MTWTSNERQCCAVKPAVTRPPQDVTALVGSDVVFECGAAGDPAPHVTWRRDGADAGPLPAGRARPTENRQGLRIERVSASDSGRYVCDVENVVGQASAGATLTVLVPPTWDWSSSSASASSSTSLSSVSSASSGNSSPLPKEVRTYPGHTVSIDCPVDGVPKPLVFWKREGKPIPALVARESSDASTRYFCRFFSLKKFDRLCSTAVSTCFCVCVPHRLETVERAGRCCPMGRWWCATSARRMPRHCGAAPSTRPAVWWRARGSTSHPCRCRRPSSSRLGRPIKRCRSSRPPHCLARPRANLCVGSKVPSNSIICSLRRNHFSCNYLVI